MTFTQSAADWLDKQVLQDLKIHTGQEIHSSNDVDVIFPVCVVLCKSNCDDCTGLLLST